jgi:hypothetical protein
MCGNIQYLGVRDTDWSIVFLFIQINARQSKRVARQDVVVSPVTL